MPSSSAPCECDSVCVQEVFFFCFVVLYAVHSIGIGAEKNIVNASPGLRVACLLRVIQQQKNCLAGGNLSEVLQGKELN